MAETTNAFLLCTTVQPWEKEEIQDDSDWAAIREAQAQTLHLNHTGMVVTTDIGKEKAIPSKALWKQVFAYHS